ncbi:MAG: hypothetical protein IPL75_21745 [Acidobacteria bacterium]|nr:hypothetical protein [Acidobacteriota bacterium]
MALPPTRPTLRMSPNPATPSEMDAKTSGITTMNNMRRKICPTGPATYLLIHSTVGLVTPTVRLVVTPRMSPTARPNRIFVCNFMPVPDDPMDSLMGGVYFGMCQWGNEAMG